MPEYELAGFSRGLRGHGMIGNQGIALTQIGECARPGCGAPVFAELLSAEAPRLCFSCAPAHVRQRGQLRGLFDRSGGRLPPDYEEGRRQER
jgi:hypothetical protein